MTPYSVWSRTPAFGRVFKYDPRDDAYPASLLLANAPAVRSYMYEIGPVQDQGDRPVCVGEGWKQWLMSAPLKTMDGPSVQTIYRHAQALDGIPDTPPNPGSTVRGGALYLRSVGRIDKFYWAKDWTVARDFILSGVGGIVVGFNWYRKMSEPLRDGFLVVDPVHDEMQGGHCMYGRGYDAAKHAFRLVNSWGTNWGQNGECWIHEEDVATLLKLNGEICCAVECKPSPLHRLTLMPLIDRWLDERTP